MLILSAQERIRHIDVVTTQISAKSCWIFITVTSYSGVTGVAEATLEKHTARMCELIKASGRTLLDKDFLSAYKQCTQSLAASIIEATCLSALAGALLDANARIHGVPLAKALGDVQRNAVDVYANINRRTVDRSALSHANSARDALQAGHRAFKIAPFDEMSPELDSSQFAVALEAGLSRIAAIRDAVGFEPDLMVDCHWRFSPGRLDSLVAALADLKLYWLECPIDESSDNMKALAACREMCRRHGMLLAGAETACDYADLVPFIESHAYDVLMPDIRHIGGPEALSICGKKLAENDVHFSPHNPVGPIAAVASLHVCAVSTIAPRLEMQFDESPYFDSLIKPSVGTVIEGQLRLGDGDGLGVSLDEKIIESMEQADRMSCA
ncbi:enolase C-terminal domain-like protein [Granulosicoccus antarcticus]|uniref:D-galactonate dehydratase n=1 Tax=Granulosicoccus antarcticus IMCC3135 TaxID=1192854 RepID=A0A2Z2NVN6_9GAMM|nr:enolase C-terminal domain-like protein [Granulosicoccus antarcticus]ASJ73788.1 D-galactonate dehydratase [Granulosicoccus antarcticus IMCC3135]